MNRIAAFFLTAAMLFLLCSCGEAPAPAQEGIKISPEAPYSAEAKAYAEETFVLLLTHYVRKTGMQTIPEATRMRLHTVASQIVAITEENRASEAAYISAMDALRQYGADAIDELYDFSEGMVHSLGATRALYLALASLLDAEVLAQTVYSLLVYSYDYRYSDAMEKYQKYEYTYLLLRAEEIGAQREILVREIGRDGFATVFLQALALTDVAFGNALQSEQLASFTNTEILLFLQSLEIEGTQIGDAGWELLLQLLIPEASENASFAIRLAAELKKEEALAPLAAVMNDVTALIASASNALSELEIAMLRNGEFDALGASVMRKMTDEDWMRIARLETLKPSLQIAHALALEIYGEAYAEYASAIVPISAEELRLVTEEADFYESLERYIAGISPALSYGMRK